MRLRRKRIQTNEELSGTIHNEKQESGAIVVGVDNSNLVGASDRSIRDARFRIYSCVFCEFVRENLPEEDNLEEGFEAEGERKVSEDESNLASDEAFEAKYLYHLSNVHGLRR